MNPLTQEVSMPKKKIRLTRVGFAASLSFFSLWLCKGFFSSFYAILGISLSRRKFKSKLLRHKNTCVYLNIITREIFAFFYYSLLNSSKFLFFSRIEYILLSPSAWLDSNLRMQIPYIYICILKRIVFSGMYSHAQNEEHIERDVSFYVSASLRVHVVFSEFPVQLNFMLWHSTIGHCTRLVWPKLFLPSRNTGRE